MKKIIYFILFFSLLIVLYLCTNLFKSNRSCTDIKFDSKLWKDSFLLRGRMVNNLIESKKLLLVERDSVVKLLGKPTQSTSDMIDYLIDMNCGNEKYGEMLLYFKIDSAKNKVIDYWLTD